jgi:hypothetical protein
MVIRQVSSAIMPIVISIVTAVTFITYAIYYQLMQLKSELLFVFLCLTKHKRQAALETPLINISFRLRVCEQKDNK